MPNTKTITGIQRGPDFDRDYYDVAHVQSVVNARKNGRDDRVNEPLITAAIEAAHEVAKSMGKPVEVHYDREKELVIIQVMDENGEKVIRQIPLEEVIRASERIKHARSQYLDNII